MWPAAPSAGRDEEGAAELSCVRFIFHEKRQTHPEGRTAEERPAPMELVIELSCEETEPRPDEAAAATLPHCEPECVIMRRTHELVAPATDDSTEEAASAAEEAMLEAPAAALEGA